jgi:hypothetical protein
MATLRPHEAMAISAREEDGTTPDWQFFRITVTMTTISAVFVIMRVSTRFYQARTLHLEDYFIIIAMVCSTDSGQLETRKY